MTKVMIIALFLILFGFLMYSIKLEKDCEGSKLKYQEWYRDANTLIVQLNKELISIRPVKHLSKTEKGEKMERLLKFRAWDNKNKIMMDASYGDWICFDGTPYTEAANKFDTPNVEIERTNDYEIMQFTGLKDKNGKEGYHKDSIVNLSRNNGKPHILEWSNKLGAWIGKYGQLEYVLATELYECEFVGNIFENSNLIEEK